MTAWWSSSTTRTSMLFPIFSGRRYSARTINVQQERTGPNSLLKTSQRISASVFIGVPL